MNVFDKVTNWQICRFHYILCFYYSSMTGLDGQANQVNHFKTVEFAAGFVLALNAFKV